MALSPFDPRNLTPPEDPNARYCDYCGDYVVLGAEYEEDTGVELLFGVVVHDCCLADYTEGLQLKIEGKDREIERLHELDMTQ